MEIGGLQWRRQAISILPSENLVQVQSLAFGSLTLDCCCELRIWDRAVGHSESTCFAHGMFWAPILGTSS